MVRLSLALAFLALCASGCASVSSAQNSNRLSTCTQGREAIARERARTEIVSEAERGPRPTVNPQDGSVAPVVAFLQRGTTPNYLRDTYQWSEVTPLDIPEKLPPWIKGSYWSVRVSFCRENSRGELLASNDYWALIRNNEVVWFDYAQRKIKPSQDAKPLLDSNSPTKMNTRPALTIKSIKAIPFNESSGLLGSDALATDVGAFWNSLDTSLLVLVELSGEGGSYEPNRKVEFIAREGSRLILKRVARIGVLNEKGNYYASFWLYGSFCQRVAMRARILGQSQSLEKTLDFQCGE